jgi:hypothetical protein
VQKSLRAKRRERRSKRRKRTRKRKTRLSLSKLNRYMNYKLVLVLAGLFWALSACNATGTPDIEGGQETPTPVLLLTMEAEPKAGEEPVFKRKPADSQEPAAGICAEAREAIVTIEVVGEGPPAPRCLIVSSGSFLVFVNRTRHPVEIEVGHNLYRLNSGVEGGIDRKVGDYLELGVHRLGVDGGFIPEIWVKQ